MSDHFISWPDILSTHLKIVIFVTADDVDAKEKFIAEKVIFVLR